MAEARSRRGGKRRSGPSHGGPLEAVAGSALEHDFSLQAIIELQRSVGRLEGKLDKLSEQVDRQQGTITWMTRVMFTAAGALLIPGPIMAWILNNRFDQILNTLAKGG